MAAEIVPVPVPVNPDNTASPSGWVFPRIENSPGSQVYLKIPPYRFKPNGILASVTAAERCGPAEAAVNVTGGAARAAVEGCAGPSEAGAANAVAVVSTVVTRAKLNIPAADVLPNADIMNPTILISCVLDPPLIAM
jgi:hypothetical protein